MRGLGYPVRARRSGRVAEGGALLRRYGGTNLHRGFESLLLRSEGWQSGRMRRSRKPFRAVRSDEGSNPSAPVNERSAPKRRSACCAAAVSASASASPHSSARVERNPPTSVLAGEPLANECPPKNTNQRVSDEHRYSDQGEARRRAVAASGTRKRPTPELTNSSPPLEVNASLLSGHARRRSGFSRR